MNKPTHIASTTDGKWHPVPRITQTGPSELAPSKIAGPVGSLRCDALVRLGRVFEYAFAIFMGIAVLGKTGDYLLALGVMLPGYWLYSRNKLHDEKPNVGSQPRA